jgi:hypothetical protein
VSLGLGIVLAHWDERALHSLPLIPLAIRSVEDAKEVVESAAQRHDYEKND